MATPSRETLELTRELRRLAPADRARRFRLLPKDRALRVFAALEPVHQRELIGALGGDRVREVLEEMEPDDRARLLDELPASLATQLLSGLSPRERRLTATVLGYPRNSAGRIMSPEVITLRPEMTVAEALATVRSEGETAETVYTLPVTDRSRRLTGIVELRELVVSPPAGPVADIAGGDLHAVGAEDDQEAVVRLVKEADLLAVPVVDRERRLVGIVTVDDAMEVMEAADAEDLARAGGAEPLRRPYFTVPVHRLVRSRIVWLMVLVAAASLTVTVLDAFEETLASVVTLALFIPLLIGTGGNAGAQAATTMTRALAVGDVRFEDLPRVVARETLVGLTLGLLFGGAGFLAVALLFGRDIAAAVSLTLVAICTLATFVGSLLPLVARRLGVDPAVVSAPMVTTLVDATGLAAYFLIAQAVLGL